MDPKNKAEDIKTRCHPLATGLFCSASDPIHHPIYPHCLGTPFSDMASGTGKSLNNAYCTKLAKFFIEKIEILDSYSLVSSMLFPFASLSLRSRMNDVIAIKPVLLFPAPRFLHMLPTHQKHFILCPADMPAHVITQPEDHNFLESSNCLTEFSQCLSKTTSL